MAIIKKSLKLPPSFQKGSWALTVKERLYLDMTILFSMSNLECYESVFGGKYTPLQCKQKSSAVYTSMDGREYLAMRTKQLENHFFEGVATEGETEQETKRTKEGFSEDFVPNVIKKLETIIENPSDPNYFDGMKLALAKVMKDMDINRGAEPPRRYLPETPCQACRYRLFIEDNVIDECARCKYKEFGNKHGLNYDHKNQLK